MSPRADTEPVTPSEVAAEFSAAFASARHVVLAVSGGSDSMALMYLAVAWRAAGGAGLPSLSAVTVDHGLRHGSADEALRVADAAARLGLAHETLHWRGGKPSRGLQAAARAMRYRLIGEHMQSRGWERLATGHTAEDQAETLLMRLARGSGIDGLSGIRVELSRPPLRVVRPLLAQRRGRLRAMLMQAGIGWSEDPSNVNPAFERSRWRQADGELAALGLTPGPVALSAFRLDRARTALDWATARALADAGDSLRIDALGYASVSWGWLTSLPAEIRLRILTRLIGAVGGHREPVSLGRLEALTEGRGWAAPVGRTLGGVAFPAGRGDEVLLIREWGRRGPERIEARPGFAIVWDNRFSIWLDPDIRMGVTVAALGEAGLVNLDALGRKRPGVPARVLHTTPALWSGGRLLAAPLLGYWSQAQDRDRIRVSFIEGPSIS